MDHLEPRRLRATLTALALLVLAVAVPASLPAPAHASQSLTWTAGLGVPGADHHSWGDPLNWSPQQVPQQGDSVTVASVGASSTVDGVPAIELSSLTLAGGDHDTRLGVEDGPITVTDAFSWTGGELGAAVTLGPGASGSVGAGHAKQLSAPLVVRGELDLDGIGTAGVRLAWDNGITVAAGGSLVSHGTSGLETDRCCQDPDYVVNRGTVEVADGELTLALLGLDQGGRVSVATGSVLTHSGQALLRDGATYDGGGTLRIEDTVSPQVDDDHPDSWQGAAHLDGVQTLADGFHLALGPTAELTGVGGLAGSGVLDLAGPNVYAALDVAHGVAVHASGPLTTRVGVWDHDRAGYTARLDLAGPVSVDRGSSVALEDRTVTRVLRGGRLSLPGGARLTAGSCCSDVPTLVLGPGTRWDLGGGGGTARLESLTVRDQGTTAVAGAVSLAATAVEQRGGRTTLAPGSVLVDDRPWELTAGRFGGVGRLRGALVAGGGTVAPGAGSRPVLRVGTYTQGRGATLATRAHGRSAHRLVVDGTARLGGTLRVSGAPVAGARTVVLHARHRSGRFTRVGGRVRVGYGGRVVTVRRR